MFSTDLQSEKPILKLHFLRQEICPNCGLVLVAKLLIHISLITGQGKLKLITQNDIRNRSSK